MRYIVGATALRGPPEGELDDVCVDRPRATRSELRGVQADIPNQVPEDVDVRIAVDAHLRSGRGQAEALPRE